ncbi:hypothetical protein QFZ53_001464 [Microbacterium natoriense]|uniref:Class F sortase n=1 Tax=Microbacterium natoriense TaxID=284570 RepID=A0AAW8EVG3_9MICO|nr:class F sortase [Microbacterium natoriense]MDQ0647268.1 hypothetical protein [Microbacterium natoriense]
MIKDRSTSWITSTMMVIGGVAVLLGAAVLSWSVVATPDGPRDLNGNLVLFDEDPPPPADLQPTADGLRLRVPQVELEVGVGEMHSVGGQVTPPDFTNAYIVRDLGGSGPGDSVYIAMHSLRGGGVAPGNSLFDADSQQALVAVGSAIYLDGVEYRITQTRNVLKKELPSDGIWDQPAGTLTLITCLQEIDGRASTMNFVVTASLVAG